MRTAESVVLTCWPPFPAGAGGVDAQIFYFEIDLDGVVDFRGDVDGRERGVAALGLIEGRDANQAMNPAFAGQLAEGVLADNRERGRFDAGFVAGLDVVEFGF